MTDVTRVPHLDIGSSIMGYTILKYCSEGDNGRVYKVQAKNGMFALKIMTNNARNQRETGMLSKVKHPNLVGFEASFEYQGYLCLVMEYLERNLAQAMKAGPTSPNQIQEWMQGLLEGVNYLHGENILHRDLNPSNVLLTDDGIIKIADFGFARLNIGFSLTPDVANGDYNSPEILLGDTSYGSPTDIWSVGCIFAEMVTLKLAFDRELSQLQLMFEGGRMEPSLIRLHAIFRELGSPGEVAWPGISKLPHYPKGLEASALQDYKRLDGLDKYGNDLLKQLLQLIPTDRITAEDALVHPYFTRSLKLRTYEGGSDLTATREEFKKVVKSFEMEP